MDSPPDFLLDALNDSITSGTFIDTKLYVFSRREASGRVSSPKPMYCNSRVLNTVPYFSALFSDRFSEGQARDINEGFPSDAVPHTEYYDYSSDSDLEDDLSCSEDEEAPREDGAIKSPLIKDKPELPQCPEGSSPQAPPTSSGDLPQPLQDTNEGEVDHQPSSGLIRMGKVAVIRDMAALTFEAMIYFLYTGKITFAPFSSDSCYGIPAESKPGDWRIPRLPSPSAKSIYRLADKYDIPTLKEQAKAYIYESVTRCDIINEVFSSFSLSFPDILSMQVSQLINKIKAESAGGSESGTRRQLRNKITALSQSQLARATDALAMIWGGVTGLLDLSMPEPESTSCARSTQLSKRQGVVFPPPSNWQSMKIALLKSIPTGTFVDTQFYAYNAIDDSLPFDLKPLFISSMVIEEWVPAIESLTVGIESGALPPMDGLTDDYEYWDEELTGVPHKVKPIPKYQIEASTTAESREVAVLGSGAWKTWTSLLSYAYTNKMTFAPLQTSTREGGDPVDSTNMQRQQHCSPRSMYSLTTVLGIEDIREDALKDIRSKLTALNVARELFTSFAANHSAVMDLEIQSLFESFTERNAKLLMEHIQKMASGGTPFLPTTLGLVYDRLLEKVFVPPIATGSTPVKPTETRGAQSVAGPAPATQTSNSTSSVGPSTPAPPPSTQQQSKPEPEPVPLGGVWLGCSKCGERARLQDLYEGRCCPRCPKVARKGRPFMQCPACNLILVAPREYCVRSACRARFV